MREAGLAGTHSRTAANERLHRDRVVRGTEGWPRRDRDVGIGNAGDGVDPADFGRLVLGSGGSSPAPARARSVLPTPGGPTKARLCRPATAISSARRPTVWPITEAEVRCVLSGRWTCGGCPGLEMVEHGQPGEVADDLAEAGRRTHVDAANRGALGPVLDRDDCLDDTRAARGRDERHRARDRAQRAVERQLSDQRDATEVRLELAGRDEDGRGHGQVVAGPLLRQVGRSQVDGDPAGRDLEA